MDEIKVVTDSETNPDAYLKHLADVLIMRANGSFYLQRHSDRELRNPGVVHLFGGHVEKPETYSEAAIREIKEETGGIINPEDLIHIGSVTEKFTGHTELVHIYFWHDKLDTITGCYEREPIEFLTAQEALDNEKIMPYTKWAILECVNKNLIQKSPL